MQINGSPDISVLLVNATFDLSGPLPVISLQNLSQGNNLPGCTFWFIATSPTGTIIHEGSFAMPDAVGAWASFAITDSWPMPFGQIEWSGAPYNVTVFVQDSTGAVYSDSSYNASICRPTGSTPKSKNYFGKSITSVQVQCQQAAIFFQDQTSPSYKGNFGTRLSSTLTLVYPIDPTGTIPPKMVMTNFSSASAPVSYGSKNYQFQTQVVYQYQLGPNVFLNIRYQSIDHDGMPFITFPVWCNIDLMPLVCEFEKLVNGIEHGTCADVEDATRKLTLINPKMALLGIGMAQPLTGIDVPELIRDIEHIGGFHCDCLNAPSGIIPTTAATAGGLTFSVESGGGDIGGTVNVVGTNVQLILTDKSYVFALNPDNQTTAFSISPSQSGYVKTYTMNINMVQLATDLANTISGNVGLVNLWNTLFGGNANLMLTVDGKCIFTSTSAYAYGFTLSNIPSNTTTALLTSITVAGVSRNLSIAFNLTNLPALQAYLNGLGIGVFVVTNPSGQNVLISSNANANNLSALTYSISSTSYSASQTTTSAGYVPISANQVIQNIINYLCGITDADMVTSQPYVISYLGANGVPQTVTISAGTSLASFFSTLVNLQDQTVDNIGDAVGVNCANIQSAFPVSENSIVSTDYVLMTKGGVCAQGALSDVFVYMLTSGLTNKAVQAAFCAFVEQCGAGLACAPYDFFEVMVTTYNSACAPIVGISYSLS